ncbi:porin [Massilia antarctica]|uniref:Porin n=2 Tax=Massilia antarctica TaxID=2765360 RepID=A0AA48WFP0_9BURK|nr:porin [Massilia sp. CCM 9206]MDQ1919742.1 porin [Massilia sp. CCM 9206]QPI50714.1 porin [Massilia antarctica]
MSKTAKAIWGGILMLAAGGASAQSSVTIGGLVDQYVGSLQYSGEPARRTVVQNGGMSTSWFGFRGVEDLGGGLKAEFMLNGFFLADTGASGRFGGDNLFSRDAFLALSGSFGKITVGRTSAPSFLPAVLFNPFGDSFQFSPLILHTYVPTGTVGARKWVATTAGDSGWSNQIQYSTPVVNNFQFNFYYAPGEQAGKSSNKNVAVNAYYNNGPLGLTAVYHTVRVSNPNGGLPILDATKAPNDYSSIEKQTGFYLGARYDFSVLKAFVTYRKNNDDAAAAREMDDKTFTLGASVPTASGAILVGYANTERGGNLLAADLKRDTLSVGYDHNLSKRTDLYTIFMSDKITASSRARSFAAGVRHRF